MTILNRLRLLPLLVIVALAAFIVRGVDFISDFREGDKPHSFQEMFDEASADDAVLKIAAISPASGGEKESHGAADEGHGDEKGNAHGEDGEADPEAEHGDEPAAPEQDLTLMEDAPSERINWQDAGDTNFAYSGVQEDLYKDLTTRRQDLEKQEQQLALREALLEAGERELDQKMRELEIIRSELESLLEEQSAEEEARITKLVKIYEGMKAKDAAQIFNTLDMDVLLAVVGQMSERKSSPVLAAMSPERARAVTILLAQQKQLPTLPQR